MSATPDDEENIDPRSKSLEEELRYRCSRQGTLGSYINAILSAVGINVSKQR